MKLTAPSGVSVVLPDNVRNDLFALCQNAFPFETGGIIYGRYSDDNLCAAIEGITAQTADSKAGRTWFHRGINKLQALLNTLWTNRLYYLGEWHFHPNGAPDPSLRDLSSLQSIAKSPKTNCSSPLMLIIAGRKETLDYRLFIVNSESKHVELQPAEP